jgi:hypothetical protein
MKLEEDHCILPPTSGGVIAAMALRQLRKHGHIVQCEVDGLTQVEGTVLGEVWFMELDCDVLIAGAGPTGVTIATLLAQRGVKVIVADKEAAPYWLPRAAHIDHEGMRMARR